MTILKKSKKKQICIISLSILLILLPNYWNINNIALDVNDKEDRLIEDSSIDLIKMYNFIIDYIENDYNIKPSQVFENSSYAVEYAIFPILLISMLLGVLCSIIFESPILIIIILVLVMTLLFKLNIS